MSIRGVYVFHRKFVNSMMWDGKKSLSQRILKEVCYVLKEIAMLWNSLYCGHTNIWLLVDVQLERGYLA